MHLRRYLEHNTKRSKQPFLSRCVIDGGLYVAGASTVCGGALEITAKFALVFVPGSRCRTSVLKSTVNRSFAAIPRTDNWRVAPSEPDDGSNELYP